MRRDAVLVLALGLTGCNKAAPSNPPAMSSSPSKPESGSPPSTAVPEVPPSASAAAADDPIAKRIAQLDPHGLWTNGLSPKLDLPEKASTAEVLSAMFPRVGFDKGHVKTHRVVEERDEKIGEDPTPYRAALVETDLGRKVVLMRFEGPTVGWWTRVYDAD